MRTLSVSRIDWSTVIGVSSGAISLIGGLWLEGGTLNDITQPAAFVSVLGGTVGAVMIGVSATVLTAAVGRIGLVICQPSTPAELVIQEIVSVASKVRSLGIQSLGSHANVPTNPYLRTALCMLLDGVDICTVRRTIELEQLGFRRRREAEISIFALAGTYAPTFGVLSAVNGLIQAMKHLSDLAVIGQSVAAAFVGTVYSLFLANMLLLPTAGKLKARLENTLLLNSIVLIALEDVVNRVHPKLIEYKLKQLLPQTSLDIAGDR